ncbi:MAG: hypothetical protein JSR66_25210 [Proteobacteria bacterium]|nr:hypothetical protein [Pseudomonadota bacterium]
MRPHRNSTGLLATSFFILATCTLTACGGGGDTAVGGPRLVVLSSFGNGDADAISPSSKLVQGSDGNFYGTALGGSHFDGVIFKVTSAGIETVLHTFNRSTGDGASPSGLILGSDGNFYGTTIAGGANDRGTVFKMTPDGSVTVLYSFRGYPSDASYADSGLVQANDGSFYGTSEFGGATNNGAVFRVTRGGVETMLYSFGTVAKDAAAGFSGLVEGSDGNFYGMSSNGGAGNYGAVFKITPEGIESLVYSFTGGAAGASFPTGGLLEGADDNFYGQTSSGGPNHGGEIFKLTPAGDLTVLYSFTEGAKTGSGPTGTLVQDSEGNLFGATQYGGSPRNFYPNLTASGTIFELTAAGTMTELSNFGPAEADGSEPFPGPIVGKDGNLYGTTQSGGLNHAGVFYEFLRK